ncbi:MAG: NAD(P)-dependent oxidoreductase [Opitutaceae bacterium]
MTVPLDLPAVEEFLAAPTAGAISAVQERPGDFIVLGAGGKMGTTLALMLRRALDRLGRTDRVIAVSRFSQASSRANLEAFGIETRPCDLSDRVALAGLPDAPNVFYLAGTKFGTSDRPDLTWHANTVIPGLVAERYARATIVAFSTGCVYPFVPVASGGATEDTPVEPLGEYGASCIGRERVFSFFSHRFGTPVCLYRLNYSVELRYGVLVDIGTKVLKGEPVDISAGYVNLIWQGEAVARAIQCLGVAASPPAALNVTGPDILRVRDLAEAFGRVLGREPVFTGEESDVCWLANASRSIDLFGPVTIGVDQMIDWIAEYLQRGGGLLGKPTHFESRTGKF